MQCTITKLIIRKRSFYFYLINTLMIAPIASTFKLGWCLISSSMALPKFEAVSPNGSALRRRRIAER